MNYFLREPDLTGLTVSGVEQLRICQAMKKKAESCGLMFRFNDECNQVAYFAVSEESRAFATFYYGLSISSFRPSDKDIKLAADYIKDLVLDSDVFVFIHTSNGKVVLGKHGGDIW